jgi:hypothetical protein
VIKQRKVPFVTYDNRGNRIVIGEARIMGDQILETRIDDDRYKHREKDTKTILIEISRRNDAAV